MHDYIRFERVWQDNDFFELEVTCASHVITATNKIYTTYQLIDELINKLKNFIGGSANECLWENGEKGDGSTAYISMRIFHKDRQGHIRIEVYMELDDGGRFSDHHCCFYVNTELGLLTEFYGKLGKIKKPQLGINVVLNQV